MLIWNYVSHKLDTTTVNAILSVWLQCIKTQKTCRQVSAAPRGCNEKVRRVCICFSLICVLSVPCSFSGDFEETKSAAFPALTFPQSSWWWWDWRNDDRQRLGGGGDSKYRGSIPKNWLCVRMGRVLSGTLLIARTYALIFNTAHWLSLNFAHHVTHTSALWGCSSLLSGAFHGTNFCPGAAGQFYRSCRLHYVYCIMLKIRDRMYVHLLRVGCLFPAHSKRKQQLRLLVWCLQETWKQKPQSVSWCQPVRPQQSGAC